jgi:hypothetical protein
MEFGPIEFATEDICDDCGRCFRHINEEAIEDRCPNCQTAFRIREAKQMHAEGIHNFVFDHRAKGWIYKC